MLAQYAITPNMLAQYAITPNIRYYAAITPGKGQLRKYYSLRYYPIKNMPLRHYAGIKTHYARVIIMPFQMILKRFLIIYAKTQPLYTVVLIVVYLTNIHHFRKDK